MDRNHSRVIIILLACILFVVLCGREAMISFMGKAFWIALIVCTLVMIIFMIVALIRFASIEVKLYRDELRRDRMEGRPWLYTLIAWPAIFGGIAVFGIAGFHYLTHSCLRFTHDCLTLAPLWWFPVPFLLLILPVKWVEAYVQKKKKDQSIQHEWPAALWLTPMLKLSWAPAGKCRIARDYKALTMHQIQKFLLANIWRWSNLRAIGNSSAVKMTIFIPLIGYMLIFNEQILRYIILSEYIFGAEVLHGENAHVSWRLIFIYFGLTFLAAGSVVYHLFCPAEIKHFATSIEYISAARSNIGEFSLLNISNTVLHKSGDPAEPISKFERFYEIRSRQKTGLTDKEMDERTILDENFHLLNTSRPRFIKVAFILYFIGFTFLFIPATRVFLSVANVAMKDVF